ncbi:WD40 repeat domain-containing protein [Phanerochaete sordida]|uniref:WD40 repeat domain-containing protein n=1 Tax=Phanerochaete sordida TaxID=48140 RepID=A0A9P3GRR5_9APHY|nr:WD40 repeat domain-containing protein [Phanerochaete sordida]
MLFWQSPPSTHPHDIYARSFQGLGYGYPLLYPEPDPVDGEVQIADVGFFREGAFIRLFNLDTSTQEKAVKGQDHLDLEQFPLEHPIKIKHTSAKIFPGDLCSHGVQKMDVRLEADAAPSLGISAGLQASFICKQAYGAVLTLKSPAHAEEVIVSHHLRRYILRNVDRYYDYATQELGHVVKQRDMVFVTGWTKTKPDWAATVLSSQRISSSEVSLGVHATGSTGAHVGGSRDRLMTMSPIPRYGRQYAPNSPRTVPEDIKEDQCLFVRRLRVRRRLFTKIVAGAGYHHLPHLDGRHSALGEEGFAAEDRNAEPVELWIKSGGEGTAPDHLDILLAYILQSPDVIVAIASDDEIESLLAGQHVVDFASWLRQARLPVEINDHGVGCLRPEELISHQQERRFARPPITAENLNDWPQITRKDAGVLTDSKILLGLTQSKACPVKYKAVAFGNSNTMKINNSRCVSISADGKLLAAATDNTILVWRLQDGLTVQRLNRDGHTNIIRQVAFSPDGQHVLSGAEDNLALLWSVKTGDVMRRLEGHENPVLYVSFSPDGTQIATRSKDSLRISDAFNGGLLHTITDLKLELSGEIFFPLGGSRIAAVSNPSMEDTTVVVLDCRTGGRLATLRKQNIRCITFSPEGDRIASGFEDGSACVWDAASGKVLLDLKEHTDWVREVVFSLDGGEVATASDDGTVVMCDSRTGERHLTFRVGSIRGRDDEIVLAMAFSPRNDFIACGAADGCVRVWNRKTGTFVTAFQGHTDWVQCVIFTPDGWNVLSYGNDRVVRRSICDALRLS